MCLLLPIASPLPSPHDADGSPPHPQVLRVDRGMLTQILRFAKKVCDDYEAMRTTIAGMTRAGGSPSRAGAGGPNASPTRTRPIARTLTPMARRNRHDEVVTPPPPHPSLGAGPRPRPPLLRR
jgi:hypothetical protein